MLLQSHKAVAEPFACACACRKYQTVRGKGIRNRRKLGLAWLFLRRVPFVVAVFCLLSSLQSVLSARCISGANQRFLIVPLRPLSIVPNFFNHERSLELPSWNGCFDRVRRDEAGFAGPSFPCGSRAIYSRKLLVPLQPFVVS